MSATFKNVHGSDRVFRTLVWSAVGTSSQSATPTTDTNIEIPYDAGSIVLSVDASAAANSSGDIDVNVMGGTRNDDNTITWDTVPYNADHTGVAATEIQTKLATPGPDVIRFRLDNNDATNSATVTLRVAVKNSPAGGL